VSVWFAPVRRAGLALALAAAIVATAPACGGEEERTFRNPVFAENFRDPFVLRVDDTYYAYGTKDAEGIRSGEDRQVVPGNVQMLQSDDLVTWKRTSDALPEVGKWAYAARTWAPEVLDAGDGRFVLYYTALSATLGRQCVGRAVADSPTGPFVDRWNAPLVCQTDQGGSIDPSPFRDDDSLYLLWKNDGNCCGMDTWIYAQRLSDDGLHLVGETARLVKQDKPWEANVVEAPTMWKQDDGYYLFFSANDYDTDLYAIGYATCERPLGPCTDAPDNPLVKSACDASGPGHQAVIRDDDGDTWLVYHAWHANPKPDEIDETVVWMDRLEWEDGRPLVRGPTCRPQPAP
jgi:beta-xylosidase